MEKVTDIGNLLVFAELFVFAKSRPEPDLLKLLKFKYVYVAEIEITFKNVCIIYEEALDEGDEVRKLELNITCSKGLILYL